MSDELFDPTPRPTEPLAADLMKNITSLLKNVGQPGVCKGCGRPITWIIHQNGKKVPYTNAGLNHFIDCPRAKDFKR